MKYTEQKLIEYLLEIIEKQNEIINKLSIEAEKDRLTGLYNRNYYDSVCASFVNFSSILMLDIDLFKNVNDTYGHDFGDKVLRVIAEIIMQNCRQTDIPIRYGGEEFVLVLHECDVANAFLVAEKIRKQIEQTAILFGDKKVFVTISIGISFSNQSDHLETGIKEADVALYESKQNGRNQTTIYKNYTHLMKKMNKS